MVSLDGVREPDSHAGVARGQSPFRCRSARLLRVFASVTETRPAATAAPPMIRTGARGDDDSRPSTTPRTDGAMGDGAYASSRPPAVGMAPIRASSAPVSTGAFPSRAGSGLSPSEAPISAPRTSPETEAMVSPPRLPVSSPSSSPVSATPIIAQITTPTAMSMHQHAEVRCDRPRIIRSNQLATADRGIPNPYHRVSCGRTFGVRLRPCRPIQGTLVMWIGTSSTAQQRPSDRTPMHSSGRQPPGLPARYNEPQPTVGRIRLLDVAPSSIQRGGTGPIVPGLPEGERAPPAGSRRGPPGGQMAVQAHPLGRRGRPTQSWAMQNGSGSHDRGRVRPVVKESGIPFAFGGWPCQTIARFRAGSSVD